MSLPIRIEDATVMAALLTAGWKITKTECEAGGEVPVTWWIIPPAQSTIEKLIVFLNTVSDIDTREELAAALNGWAQLGAAALAVVRTDVWWGYREDQYCCRYCQDHAIELDLMGHKDNCPLAELLNILDAEL